MAGHTHEPLPLPKTLLIKRALLSTVARFRPLSTLKFYVRIMSLEQEFISWFLLAWPMVCRLVLWLVGRSVVVPLLQDINFL